MKLLVKFGSGLELFVKLVMILTEIRGVVVTASHYFRRGSATVRTFGISMKDRFQTTVIFTNHCFRFVGINIDFNEHLKTGRTSEHLV